MKKIFCVLAFSPLISFASQEGSTNPLTIFKNGCKNNPTIEQRQNDCARVRMLERAASIATNISQAIK